MSLPTPTFIKIAGGLAIAAALPIALTDGVGSTINHALAAGGTATALLTLPRAEGRPAAPGPGSTPAASAAALPAPGAHVALAAQHAPLTGAAVVAQVRRPAAVPAHTIRTTAPAAGPSAPAVSGHRMTAPDQGPTWPTVRPVTTEHADTTRTATDDPGPRPAADAPATGRHTSTDPAEASTGTTTTTSATGRHAVTSSGRHAASPDTGRHHLASDAGTTPASGTVQDPDSGVEMP